MEPGAGIIPVSVCSCERDPKGGSGLLDIQARKVPKADEFEDGGVFSFEFSQCFVDGQNLVRRRMHGHVDGVDVKPLTVSTPFLSVLAACLLNQDPSHGFGCGRKEVPARIPMPGSFDVHQTQVRLMDQGSCLQGLARLLLRHTCSGEFAQFLIHQRQQMLRSRCIARFDLLQDLRDVVHGDI